MVTFLVAGCGQGGTKSESSSKKTDVTSTSQKTSTSSKTSTSNNTPSRTSASAPRTSSKSSSSVAPAHTTHTWSTEWDYNETQHWHSCTGCDAKNSTAGHTLGDAQTVNLGEYLNNDLYQHSTVKLQKCSVCGYEKILDGDVLPRLNFQCDTASDVSFATSASASDQGVRPEVSGKLTLDNCGDSYKFSNVEATMKVRGIKLLVSQRKVSELNLRKLKIFLV